MKKKVTINKKNTRWRLSEHCPSCGHYVYSFYKFCPECGQELIHFKDGDRLEDYEEWHNEKLF